MVPRSARILIAVMVALVIAVGVGWLATGPEQGLEHKPGAEVAALSADALARAGSVELQLGANGAGGSLSLGAPDEARGLAFVAPTGTSPSGDEVVSVDGRLFVFTKERSYSLRRGLFSSAAPASAARWLRLPVAANTDPRFRFLGLQKLVRHLRTPPEGGYEKVSRTTLDGQSAVQVTAADGAQLFVAATGEPRPLRLVQRPGDAASEVTFAYFGTPPTVAAPTTFTDATN